MMSKQIKGLPRKAALSLEKKEPTIIGKIGQKIAYAFQMYLYYPVDDFFSLIYERTSRSLAFAKHGWMHYDFESAYIYDLMAFKMKRIYACLENGHAVQHKEDMKALKEAIKICERLFEGNYDYKYHRAHDKKWGRSRMSTGERKEDKDGNVTYTSIFKERSKVKNAAMKKKERKEFMKTWEDGEKDRQADLDRLNEILKKHEPSWWD